MNTKDILLESASGFMMPFEASEEEEVQVSLGFGEQTHPMTGERFHHRGVDFAAVVCFGDRYSGGRRNGCRPRELYHHQVWQV